jgi:glycosyltransferase involved in cell wall biosynthesis
MAVVTTLIPVFNGAAFVQEAVDSALAQRGVDVEVVVIDDGSTDSTPEILASYGSRIRVIRQKNGGHVNARNNGARLARGTWLAFLDADDAWLPDKLEKQLQAATEAVGLVYTDRQHFGDTNRVSHTASESNTLWEGEIFERLLAGNFVTVASAMMRRDWFERLGGFDERLLVCEDWDLWLRFAGAGGVTAVVREPLTRYRLHAASMSNDQTRMCEGRLIVLERALGQASARNLDTNVVRKARASAWQCSAWHAVPWSRPVAATWYLRSLLYWPWNARVYRDLIKCVIGRA